ncbi:ANL_collapsed_G0053080.mRNA.1.CDS.1 [Saccharomyces cerevisiae]|nr:ANL_collapsed_G0053080.mRNA.1.CDS.1 [Saccharomyces cerevisiae]
MERLCDSGSNMLTISDEGESNDLFLLPDGFRMWISLVHFRLLVRLLLQRNPAIKYKFQKMTDQEN